jgi:multicomponent Na+:H+ antiporter subunit E
MIFGNMLLALTWAALSGRFTLESLVTGAILGRCVLMILAKGDVLPMRAVGRFERSLSLLGYLLWQILLANFRITMDVLSVQYRMRPGVIRLPLDVKTDGEILLLAAMINITPGSVALDVSADRSVMYVHVMNIRTPEDARREIKEGFERRVLELGVDREKSSNAA